MPLAFTKMEAAGNDLILLDERPRTRADPGGLARRLCDRHFGVGSDGLLVIETGEDGLPLMRMFNPDGTEDFCGNGLRCAAAWLFDRGEAHHENLLIRTPRGVHRARVCPSGPAAFSVDMEILRPLFRPRDIPMIASGEGVLRYPLEVAGERWAVSCVNTGTTHTALFAEREPGEEVFARVSPLIERHPAFPERTSVLWCRPEGRERVHVRVWERGVGETLACGSGACAAVVLGRCLGLLERGAEVVMRGGRMFVRWPEPGVVRLAGQARIVYSGQWLGPVEGREASDS